MQTEDNRYAAADRLRLGEIPLGEIERIRRAIRRQSFESAFAWDAQGNLVAARDGNKEHVSLRTVEFESLPGGVVVHSHPNNTPFSI